MLVNGYSGFSDLDLDSGIIPDRGNSVIRKDDIHFYHRLPTVGTLTSSSGIISSRYGPRFLASVHTSMITGPMQS